jgi:hypothetical protein
VAATEADRDGLALVDRAVLRTTARGDLIVAVDGRPVRCPSRRSSGAFGPPILVGTQPGSTVLLSTLGQSVATAAESVATKSLLSE